jgi:Zn-dependent protease
MTPGEVAEIRRLATEGPASERARPGALQVGRFRGIPVYVHVSWVAILALVSWALATGSAPAVLSGRPPASNWTDALVVSCLLFVSVLLHELGHTMLALGQGLTIRSVTLFIFGGVAQLETDPEDGWTELKVAAIGPAVSLVLAASFALAAALPLLGAGGRAIAWPMACVNFGLAAFNLLPAFPLDGGRLLRAGLWLGIGKLRATQVASGVGGLLALGVTAFGVFRLLAGDGATAVWCVLVGWFLKDGAVAAYEQVRLREGLRGLAVRDAMLTEVATIPAHIALSELAPEHFLRGGYHSYPVVRGEGVVGLLSVREVLALPPEERERTSVQAVMTPLAESIVVGPGEPLFGAMARMARGEMRRLLVVEDGRLAGLLSMSSIFRHMRMREAFAS